MIVGREKPYLVRYHSYSLDIRNYRRYLRSRRNYYIAKRIFDIVFSALVIVFILSWLIPVIALCVKLSSRGPVFFVQKRVGYLGKTFHCLKFRTMRVNALADKLAARENDSRITRIGRFLRTTNLDELPQFFNVLMGDMSIVGPRPHMHADCHKFSRYVENYKFRNLIKPGITGLAQVKGYRGPANTFEDIFHRFQYDAFYVRNANFGLDIRIIRKTFAQTIYFIIGKVVGRDDLQEVVQKKKIYRRFAFSIKQVLN
ncbi:MAG TPA: sugar transferase [Parasegetibacter sp.]